MLSFILFICLSQAFVNVEGRRICEDLYPEELKDKIVVDANLLPVVCPKTISYLDCLERELPRHVDSFFNGTKDVVISICEEGNELHKGYVKHFECYQNFDGKWTNCYNKGRGAYSRYRLTVTTQENDEDEKEEDERDDEDSMTSKEADCMIDAFALGCLGVDTLLRCGREAELMFVDLVRRSQILTVICGEKEKEKLRNDFLPYLLFQDFSRKEVVLDMFDMFYYD